MPLSAWERRRACAGSPAGTGPSMSRYEPVLHALEVEPPVARPGQTVRLTFRTRNVGTLPSPAGIVVFALPPGVEPLGDPEAALPSAAPGEPAVATLCARIGLPFEDRTELALQAVLILDGERLPTNVCVLQIRSRAILDGGASGTFVDAVDADVVRVRAVVTNEGDGPALRAHVRLPAPAGCRRLDGDDAATLDVERLDPGESVSLTLDARIERVMPSVSAAGAEVRCGNGTRWALPERSTVSLQPLLAAPVVTVESRRRRVEAAVELRNDGWVHAHDVDVRIDLPTALRLDAASVEVDGAPVALARARRGPSSPVARLRSHDGVSVLTLALVRARATTHVRFSARHAGDFDGGTLRVGVADRSTQVDVLDVPCRDVRIEPLAVPAVVTPGGESSVRVRIVNAADRAEQVQAALVSADVLEAAPQRRTIEAGSATVVDLPLAAGASDADGNLLVFAVVVSDEAGAELARADLETTVRAPVVPVTTPSADDDPLVRAQPVLHAALRAAEDVVAGTALAVRLDIDVEDALDQLNVRVPDVAGTRYVAGSSSVGGCALVDGGEASPLHGDGVLLRAVPPGTRVTIGWSLLVAPAAAESLALGADLDADGRRYELAPLAVRVLQPRPFAARPTSLAYHVEACTVPLSLDPPRSTAAVDVASVAAVADVTGIVARPEAALDDDAVRTIDLDDVQRRGVELDDDTTALAVTTRDTACAADTMPAPRWEEIARLMHGVRCTGLIAHVLALRPFFPAALPQPVTAADLALDAVGDALRDVFDRLFVKLRIPGFVVAADDVEDTRLRAALVALAGDEMFAFSRAELAAAPLGAPVALRALLALIPLPDGDTLAVRAAAIYLRALDAMLASYADLPIAVFDEALARGREDELDDARRALLAGIDAQTAAKASAR